MENKKQTGKVIEQPKQDEVTLEQASIEQLKAAAFDTEQQIKGMQRNYQTIINELQRRTENKQNN